MGLKGELHIDASVQGAEEACHRGHQGGEVVTAGAQGEPVIWGKGEGHLRGPDSGWGAGWEPLSSGIAFVSFQKQQPSRRE